MSKLNIVELYWTGNESKSSLLLWLCQTVQN